MKISGELDRIDRKILAELQAEGRLAITALAERVGLSKTPCQQRVRRLEEAGFIKGYAARLDLEKMESSFVRLLSVAGSTMISQPWSARSRRMLRFTP